MTECVDPSSHVERVLDTLQTATLARTEWDESPEVGFLFTASEGVRLLALPVPEFVWTMGHPAAITAGLAVTLPSMIKSNGISLVTSSYGVPVYPQGAYLRCESWTLPQHYLEETYRRRQAGGSTPRFETMADRIECRTITAVDVTGRVYITNLERGSSEVATYSTDVIGPQGVDGRVPTALAALLDAVRQVKRKEGGGA